MLVLFLWLISHSCSFLFLENNQQESKKILSTNEHSHCGYALADSRCSIPIRGEQEEGLLLPCISSVPGLIGAESSWLMRGSTGFTVISNPGSCRRISQKWARFSHRPHITLITSTLPRECENLGHFCKIRFFSRTAKRSCAV